MARAKTKEELLKISVDNFDKLLSLIDSFMYEQQNSTFKFEDRDRNIRDVMVHLFEWHQLLLKWVDKNQSGIKTNFLPEPYNWKTYPTMNIVFWEKHQKTPYTDSINDLKKSHAEVMRLIATFSDEELFTNKYFDWTGTTSLGSYIVSATASHYDWALKKVKKHKKLSNHSDS